MAITKHVAAVAVPLVTDDPITELQRRISSLEAQLRDARKQAFLDAAKITDKFADQWQSGIGYAQYDKVRERVLRINAEVLRREAESPTCRGAA